MARGGKRTLVAGAVTLALAGAVTRGIGAVYHVVVVRVAGPEALGLFQMAMPIHSLASGAASMGFHVAQESGRATTYALCRWLHPLST